MYWALRIINLEGFGLDFRNPYHDTLLPTTLNILWGLYRFDKHLKSVNFQFVLNGTYEKISWIFFSNLLHGKVA
jgi:hypothetical protein